MSKTVKARKNKGVFWEDASLTPSRCSKRAGYARSGRMRSTSLIDARVMMTRLRPRLSRRTEQYQPV
jgi:hypothetical protein